MIAGSGMTTEFTSLGDRECRPLFSGMQYCTEILGDGSLFFLQNRENK